MLVSGALVRNLVLWINRKGVKEWITIFLSVKERRAIQRLKKLAKAWPESLSLFSNSGTLEVHKTSVGDPYTEDTLIDEIFSITNDGGDRS